MLSGRNIHCAQDIVGACQFGRLSVDGYVPAVRIIDFGEYGNTVLGIVRFVRQAVRCVTCQADAGEAVFITFRGTFQHILEAGIHYGCLRRYDAVQGVNLFVGVVHILHLVYKPCIAVGVWVEDGNGLSLLPCREDEVFGVQHVQYAELIGIHAVHLTSGGGNGLVGRLHFGRDVMLYHFLVAAQLGRVITADAFVPVGGVVVIEGAGGKVQYTIVQAGILQYQLVCIRLGEGFRTDGVGHELGIIQIALVDPPHICQAEYGDTCNGQRAAQLAACIEPEQAAADAYDDEATQGVAADEFGTHLSQVGKDAGELVGGYHLLVDGILQHLCLLGGHVAGADAARGNGKQQGDACSEQQADAEGLLFLF